MPDSFKRTFCCDTWCLHWYKKNKQNINNKYIKYYIHVKYRYTKINPYIYKSYNTCNPQSQSIRDCSHMTSACRGKDFMKNFWQNLTKIRFDWKKILTFSDIKGEWVLLKEILTVVVCKQSLAKLYFSGLNDFRKKPNI